MRKAGQTCAGCGHVRAIAVAACVISDAMSMTPEELYFELGRLLAEMPDLATGPITPEINRWLARAGALVESSGSLAEIIQLRVARNEFDGPVRARKAQTIAEIVHRSLAMAEANAPPAVQGAVIAVGDSLDAYKAVRKVLVTAKTDVLFVDPYADAKILADYAVLAPEKLNVRLLADGAGYKPSLKTAAQRWARQLANHRTLMVRLAAANTLHDRLILVDGGTVWILAHSFGSLAKSAHTSLIRMRPEAAARKIAVYAEIWREAQPLLP